MKIAYVNVFVSDLGRSLKFYQDVLGLDLQFSSPEHGYASLLVGDNLRLGLAVAGADNGELVGRHTGIGFEVQDLVAAHARLAARGTHFTMPPTTQPWGGVMAMLSDPDGNTFYLDQAQSREPAA